MFWTLTLTNLMWSATSTCTGCIFVTIHWLLISTSVLPTWTFTFKVMRFWQQKIGQLADDHTTCSILGFVWGLIMKTDISVEVVSSRLVYGDLVLIKITHTCYKAKDEAAAFCEVLFFWLRELTSMLMWRTVAVDSVQSSVDIVSCIAMGNLRVDQ